MSLKFKLRASGLHFIISLLIFSVLVVTILYQWFPEPFFTASGGIQGFKLVALIDLVLGPLMTLVIFNASKSRKELFFDLSLIVIIQVSALIYGVSTVYSQRPVAVTFWDNSFYTVPYNEINKHYSGSHKLEELTSKELEYFFVPKPETFEQKNQLLDKVKRLDIPPHHQIELYLPLKPNFQSVVQKSLNIDAITEHSEELNKQLKNLLKGELDKKREYIYLPLQSKYENIILVFDRQGNINGYLNTTLTGLELSFN